jgi:pyruvate kinase
MTVIERDEEDELRRLLGEVQSLRDEVKREGAALLEEWGATIADSKGRARAFNLAHYVALRGFDLTQLQYRLAAVGLSSLGRSESAVVPALDALVATLRRLNGERANPYPGLAAMRAGSQDLEAETATIFGPQREDAPNSRILATLPPEAAVDSELVEDLVAAGMDCARINCAHDSAESWAAMIDNVRAAERKLGVECRILMDIAGPKCRVSGVEAEPKYRLMSGDRALIVRRLDARKGEKPPRFTISFPEVLSQLKVGQEVYIDDGKAAARVTWTGKDEAEIEVYAAREKGVRLKADKGLNFPNTDMQLPALTTKDFRDLDFVAAHADIVGFSFVQRVEDIELLQDHLAARRRGQPPQAIVLKIETPLAVRNLPRLILKSLAHHPTAVMIARGDLAVEIGFARLSEMQEEILWLCEAARTPVVWATQVLDQFVRDGMASRSEMTDAAVAQGAECVMLNKGPHLAEGVAFLRDVLGRIDRHRAKKFPRFTHLQAWSRA